MEFILLITSSLIIPFLLLIIASLILQILLSKPKDLNSNKFLPTPPKHPILGHLYQIRKPPLHRALWELSQKYGHNTLLYYGRVPVLVISSVESAKQVLKTNDVDFRIKSSLLVSIKRLSYNYLDVIFAPYGEYWREIRKECVLEFLSVKKVKHFGFVRAEEVAHMVDCVSKSSYSNTLINLSEKVRSLSAQIVFRIVFGNGYEIRELENGKFQSLFEAIEMVGRLSATDVFPMVGWIIDRLTGSHAKLEKSFHDLDSFYEQVINDHLKLCEKSKLEHEEDLIDALLKLEKEQFGSFGFTKDHIKGTITNLLSGSENTSIPITWAMTELIKNPDSMKKVQEEIRNFVGTKGKVDEADLEHFIYLKMVVKETLRLHPSSPILIREPSTENGKVNKYKLKSKTMILINTWAMGRDPEYWEKPDEFLPERFTNNSIDFRGSDFEFLPFGAGRRVCPAINLGIAMVELVLANLLYSFDWELPSGMNKEDIDMEESMGINARKKIPLLLVPIKYNCSP
ncbi:cytochrome P450 71B36-like [Papaver somniferum]|uniref:cytochrome P450 71B36-like n=1 Tax=Papaver somniferum TaxID=3469 RepID=UPI000E703F62|nr:cytochrome P450 71B36-like [Papaver somniferum]